MALDGQWVQVSTDAFADAPLLGELSLNQSRSAMKKKLLEENTIITEISTVGNTKTIIQRVGYVHHVSRVKS